MVVALRQSIRGASNPWGAVKDTLANLVEVVNAATGSTLSLEKGGSPAGAAALIVPGLTAYGFSAKTAIYQATVTVANGATTGKEASIGIPAYFTPQFVLVEVTTAATNAVTLNDIGDDADTDSYVDGATVAVNTTGFKGVLACNGVRSAGPSGGAATPDEVEIVISGDPGATGVTLELTFIGFVFATV